MKTTLVVGCALLALLVAAAAQKHPPYGHSNVGGGPGNSGPGDKHGAPGPGDKSDHGRRMLLVDPMPGLTESNLGRHLLKLIPVKENGGGHTPRGNANGVPTYYETKSGHRPPGHNP